MAAPWESTLVHSYRIAHAPGGATSLTLVPEQDNECQTVVYHVRDEAAATVVCGDAVWPVPGVGGDVVGAVWARTACEGAEKGRLPGGCRRVLVITCRDRVVVAMHGGGWAQSVPVTEFEVAGVHKEEGNVYVLGAPALHVLEFEEGGDGVMCRLRPCDSHSPSLDPLCYQPVQAPSGSFSGAAAPFVKHVVPLSAAGCVAVTYSRHEFVKRVQLTGEFYAETFLLSAVPDAGLTSAAQVEQAYPARAAEDAFWVMVRPAPGSADVRLLLLQFPAGPAAGDVRMEGDDAAPSNAPLTLLHEIDLKALQYSHGDAARLWILQAGSSRLDVLVAADTQGSTHAAVVLPVEDSDMGDAGWRTSALQGWSECVGSGAALGAMCALPAQCCVEQAELRVWRTDAPVVLDVRAVGAEQALRERLANGEVFGCDREAAYAAVDVDPAAPDALETFLDALVEKGLAQLIIKWCQERGFEDMGDLAILRSVLHWYYDALARLLERASAWVQANVVDTLPAALDDEYHTVAAAATQFTALGQFLLELCEDLNDPNVRLAEEQRHLRAVCDQLKHAAALHSIGAAAGGAGGAFTSTAVELMRRREALVRDHAALVESSLSNAHFIFDTLREQNAVPVPVGTSYRGMAYDIFDPMADAAEAAASATAAEYCAWGTQFSEIADALKTHPSGLVEKFASLNEASLKVVPPCLVFDVLYHHATLLNQKALRVFAPNNTLDVQTLFQPYPYTRLEKGCRVMLARPVGAGWTAGKVLAVNDGATFDLLTAEGQQHLNIPLPMATLEGVKPVVHDTAQEFLRLSVVFYHILCVGGMHGVGSLAEGDALPLCAFAYAREHAGLPRGWLMFLTALWVVEFGTAEQRAAYPLHLPSTACLEQCILDTLRSELEASELAQAVRCLQLCAVDCASRAALTLWARHARDGSIATLVPALNVLHRHGNKRLYPKAGTSLVALFHIYSLCAAGTPVAALDVARSLRSVLGVAFALLMLLEGGGAPAAVFQYPLSADETAALHRLINCIAAVQKKDRGALSGRLASVDTTVLKVALHQVAHEGHEVYRTLLRADRTAEFGPLLRHLEQNVLPPASASAIKASVANDTPPLAPPTLIPAEIMMAPIFTLALPAADGRAF
eukprot:TRINITY_DN22167_c0_g1_i1.p1 TRINITY_DN22167_c0_g1~~TRINITY_DN22167_c0_g1_i1.p1  ORF type:complete len:1131 (+),score=321.64 TRINITY_DN22167_c0_g1_i1:46-3438(+)